MNIRSHIISFILAAILCSTVLFSQTPSFKLKTAILDAGNVRLPLLNNGNVNSGLGGTYSSIAASFKGIVFDHGVTIIGKMNDTVKALMNFWQSPYSVGPIINGLPAFYSPLGDTSRYGPFKISRGDTPDKNPDLNRWPKDLGAPVTPSGKPLVYGDQTIWMVYNGADSVVRPYMMRNSPLQSTLPLEIRQTVYSYKNPPAFSPSVMKDVVFMEWEIINKGTTQIDSCFIGFWTDIDFNPAYDNIPAVDTTRGFGYCWTGQDSTNGVARTQFTNVGYALLYGPNVPSPGDSAVAGFNTLPNRKNLSLTNFWGIGDDSYANLYEYGPPYSVETAWNVARGFDRNGNVMIDSSTGKPTRFRFSGDPITKAGWNFPYNNTGGGAGFLFYSGPVTMAPSDTQWMLIALLPNVANTSAQSIQELRLKMDLLREMSVTEIRGTDGLKENGVTSSPFIPVYHNLYRNYPNPFNPSTTITYDVGIETDVEITVHSILGQNVAALVKGRKPAGRYTVDFNANGLAGGVYFCRMNVNGILLTQKMLLLR